MDSLSPSPRPSPNLKKRTFKINNSESTNSKEAFRIILSSNSLLSLRLRPGDLCNICFDGKRVPAIAWTAGSKGNSHETIVQVSDTFKEHAGLKIGQTVDIERIREVLPEITLLRLLDVGANDRHFQDEGDKLIWAAVAATQLRQDFETLVSQQKVVISLEGRSREYVVLGNRMPLGIARLSSELTVSITENAEDALSMKIDSTGLGGMTTQLEQVQNMITWLTQPPSIELPTYYKPKQGLLIYGSKGTGKSLLVEKILKCPWSTIIPQWKPSQDIPKVLDEPALIIISDLDTKYKTDDSISNHRISALKNIFESVQGKKILVVGETRHPNNIDETLRISARFDNEVELPVPTALERLQILRAIRGTSTQPVDAVLSEVAAKTHGYVGADLFASLQVAVEMAMKRKGKFPIKDSSLPTIEKLDLTTNGRFAAKNKPIEEHGVEDSKFLQVNSEHLSLALSQIRPTALQEVFLETPDVRWSQIGGQHDIKRRLQHAIERPLKNAEVMKKLNLRPKKGVLLYGPPGCSKTLLVKALATEADINFLAVKGAELISMYVGESERAIREVFRKARAASPSIIFFDEIDSIASSRHSELNVLTTLLNEMDGFEELKNVLVVAATNKPQQIDPALMRPGRLDNVVYVGPPDEATRKEILRKWFARSRVVDVEPADIAGTRTERFSGAELISICETAGEYAMDDGRDHITREDFEKAIDDTPRGITSEMLEDYERWQNARK